jgi:hypothetical protein
VQNSFYFGRLRVTLLLPDGDRDVPAVIRTSRYDARFCKGRLSVFGCIATIKYNSEI